MRLSSSAAVLIEKGKKDKKKIEQEKKWSFKLSKNLPKIVKQFLCIYETV